MSDAYSSLLSLAEHRKSVRRFSSKPVPGELVSKITRVCATSPYACGSGSWEIVVVDNPSLINRMSETINEECRRICETVDLNFREEISSYCRNFGRFGGAPLLLLPVYRVPRTLSIAAGADKEFLVLYENETYAKSIACVSMLALLAAESLGLGACLMTGPLLAETKLAVLAGVRPGRRIGAVIPVGYTEE